MKKFMASALATLMTVSLMSVSVSAATGAVTTEDGANGVKTMTFGTQLNMSKDAITAPKVDFVYSIAAATTANDTYKSQPVLSGIMDAVTFTNNTVSLTTGDILPQDVPTSNNYFAKDLTISFDVDEFPETGIYHYVLSVAEVAKGGLEMGTDLDKDIYVFVTYENDKRTINEIIMYNVPLSGTDAVDKANKADKFLYSYGIGDNNGEPNPTPGADGEEYVLSVIAKGDMADRTKKFTYTIAGAGIDEGTIFKATAGQCVVYKDGKLQLATVIMGDNNEIDSVTATGDVIVNLASGATYELRSVIPGMTFTTTITEEAGYNMYNRDGVMEAVKGSAWTDADEHTVTIDKDTDNEGSDFATVRGADDTEDDDKDIVYDGSLIPDTGVILQILPFMLLALFLAAMMGYRAYRFSTRK